MKKLLSCIIAVTMVICMIPETIGFAFADDTYQAEPMNEQVVSETASEEANAKASAEEVSNDQEADKAEAEQEETEPAVSSEETEEVVENDSAVTEEEAPAVTTGEAVTEDGDEAVADETAEEPVASSEEEATVPETSDETQEEIGDTEEEVQPVIDLKDASVELSRTVFAYNGKAKKPKVTVTLSDGTVVDPKAYTVKYPKNKEAGTAKVRITGNKDANAKGKAEATFTILGKMDKVDASSRKKSSITVTWSKYTTTDIDGYKLFKYSEKQGKYIVVKTVKGQKETSFTVKNLRSAHKYKFKIAPYAVDKATGKAVIGPKSDAKSLKTAPKAPSKRTKLTSLSCKAPYVLVKWKNLGKDSANRYQIQYSRDPNFKNAAYIITVKSTKATSKRIYGLRNYTRYYVRVRAGKSYGGQEAYGKWSKSSSVISYSTGWTTYNGRKYYYSSGKALKGSHYLNGNPYYFDPKTGELHGCSYRIWKKVKNATSDTKSLVTIDCTNHRVNVFRKRDGDWVCIKQWICSSGQTEVIGEYKKTPKGTHKLRYKLKHFGEEKGYTCWYACNFSGHSFIHSVLYNPYSMTSIQDGRLGINASHGCVRLALKNAKWIYDHVKKGSTVISI